LRIEFVGGKPLLLWEIKFYISEDTTQLADQLDFVKFYIDAKTGKVVKFNFEPYFAINMNMYDARLTSNIIPIPTSLYKVIKIMDKGEWNFPYNIMTPPDYAKSALDNITKTLSFYKNKFNRNSYDNAGSVVDVVVNVARYNSLNPMQSNAAWIPDKKMFIFGAGNDEMSAFVKSLDIVAHEYTHAVISSTSNLDYSSQTGAINESLADTFGFFVDDDDYLIGEDLLLKPENGITAIRNMKDPKIGVKFPQPDNTDSAEFKNYGEFCSPTIFNDSCGVHILSGITNKAAYLIIEKLGKSKSAKIYYRATTERLKSNSDFIDLKNQLFESCLDLSKVDGTINEADCKYIKSAFLEVGIK
jgi:Zn-dependent metalloprotease